MTSSCSACTEVAVCQAIMIGSVRPKTFGAINDAHLNLHKHTVCNKCSMHLIHDYYIYIYTHTYSYLTYDGEKCQVTLSERASCA